MSRGDFWQPLIAPEARKERSGQSFSASHIGPRADCPFHRPAFFRPAGNDKKKMADVSTVMFSRSSAETIEHAKAFWKSIQPLPEPKSTLVVSGINHRLQTAAKVPNGW